MTLLRTFLIAASLISTPLLAVERQPVPAEFLHDQVWVTPTLKGERLRFFTDTGGGWNAIAAPLVERLAMPRESVEGGDLVPWPAFDEAAAIPVGAIEGPLRSRLCCGAG